MKFSKKSLAILLILITILSVISVAVVMWSRKKTISNNEVSSFDVSAGETAESQSQAIYMPTEKEVIDKFNSYLKFADKWIRNYYDNLNELGYYTDSEGNLWAYINDNEYKTADLLKLEVRKYFETGTPVEFIDKAKDINGRICYPTDYGCGNSITDEFDDISIDKLNDNTFEITYHLTVYDPNAPRFYIYDEVLHYRPNEYGEWYFYESKSSECTSWETYFKKYLKTGCENCNAFSLTDINKDGIPEMILYAADPQKDKNRMLGYDKINSLGYLEWSIEFVEIENSDYICKIDTNGNYIKTVVYDNDGKILWEGEIIEHDYEKTYYSNNKETTMLEYMQLINQYCPENKRKSLDRYDLNQENLDKYLFG